MITAPGGSGELGQALAQVERDGVAVAMSARPWAPDRSEVALLGLLAQVVVPHQAVEIERRGGSGIGVDRGDLRQVA